MTSETLEQQSPAWRSTCEHLQARYDAALAAYNRASNDQTWKAMSTARARLVAHLNTATNEPVSGETLRDATLAKLVSEARSLLLARHTVETRASAAASFDAAKWRLGIMKRDVRSRKGNTLMFTKGEHVIVSNELFLGDPTVWSFEVQGYVGVNAKWIGPWHPPGTRRPRTAAQNERQAEEHRARGKYAKVNPCERCGKSAGVSYYSDHRCNTGGYGLVLCRKCAGVTEAMDDATFYSYTWRREGA